MLAKLIRWARVTRAAIIGDQYPVQQLSYQGKAADGMNVFPYGTDANVPAGNLALMFAVGADADNRAQIPTSATKRPDLQPGEVAFYHPQTMGWIIWREGGNLEIVTGDGGAGDITVTCANADITASENVDVTCVDATVTASASVTLDSPETTITGNLTVGGDTALGSTVTSNGTNIGETHVHSGVQSGGSNSGPPV